MYPWTEQLLREAMNRAVENGQWSHEFLNSSVTVGMLTNVLVLLREPSLARAILADADASGEERESVDVKGVFCCLHDSVRFEHR